MKEYTIKRFELKSNQSDFPKKKIASSNDANEFIRQFYSDDIDIFESCFVLLLNQANFTIGYAKISQGGITGTFVDPQLVAKYAIESLAKAVVLAHNHPSGNLAPSSQDLDITKRIRAGLDLFNITLLDHIILTSDHYTSLGDEGLL